MGVLGNLLADLCGCYSLIVESKDWILAAIDKIRGYPIFYSKKAKEILFSNSARKSFCSKGSSSSSKNCFIQSITRSCASTEREYDDGSDTPL